MSIGQPERATQNRVIALFRDELHYRYLGDWTDRDGNSNIEEESARGYLTKSGLHAGADQPRHLQTAHRGGQPQPRPLRQQQGRLQPAALRRAGEDRGGQGHGNGAAHQLGGAGEERLRHRRGGHAAGQPRAAARPRALRQRHRRRRDGTEEQPRQHRRRHPPVSFQPAAGIQRVVLHDRAVHLRGQRLRGAAATAPSGRRRSTSCGGRKTRRTTAASSWTSICSRCAARTG